MNKNSINLSKKIYKPQSQLTQPSILMKDMWCDLLASRELAWRLFIRNISALYRRTILGYIWAFLPPVVTTMTFVFLNNQKIFSVGETAVPYPVYVMIGTILWQVFFDAVMSPIKIINASKSMLTKINFPREALILAGVLEVLFNFIIRLSLWIGIVIIYDVGFPNTIAFAPIGVAFLLLLGLMIGILLTPLAVLYQDVERSLVIINSLWFFLTPVVYPPPTSGPALLLVKLNPVSPLLVTTRDWVLTGATTELATFSLISGLALIFMAFGWLLYRLAMPHLIARIGS